MRFVSLRFVTVAILSAALMSSCDSFASLPEVSEIRYGDSSCLLSPGQRITLSVDVTGSSTVTFKWTLIGNGKLIGSINSSNIIYEAPNGNGSATIKIEVKDQNSLITKSLDCKTIAPTPTLTSTRVPTLTLAPTNTPTPVPPTATALPTRTATATSTLVPTPTRESFFILSPLDGTGLGCASGTCTIKVSVQWVLPEQRFGRNLYILVRPFPANPSFNYFVQELPTHVTQGVWQVNPVYVGAAGDTPGTPFAICALITTQTLNNGQSFNELAGIRQCINVTR